MGILLPEPCCWPVGSKKTALYQDWLISTSYFMVFHSVRSTTPPQGWTGSWEPLRCSWSYLPYHMATKAQLSHFLYWCCYSWYRCHRAYTILTSQQMSLILSFNQLRRLRLLATAVMNVHRKHSVNLNCFSVLLDGLSKPAWMWKKWATPNAISSRSF